MGDASAPNGPLTGIRVLCVNNYLAGNYGPELLAMHGADVVKVETARGEAGRSSRPVYPAGNDNTWSHFEIRMMRGKRSIVIDLEDVGGRRTFDDLVRACDVFWTNLRPDSAARRRVDWPTISALNERVIYASLTGFGLPENGEGEFSGLPAFDILVQGLAGLLARNADEDGIPIYNGLALADQVASLYGALGVLLGLQQRDRQGTGCCVDVAMFDAMVALNEKAMTMYGLDGNVPPPRASVTTAPFGVYPTRDGHAVIAVGSDAVWLRFCDVVGPTVGRHGLRDDERFHFGTGRVAEAAELDKIVRDFTLARSTDEVVEALLAHDVPAGHALDVDDLHASSHVRARGILRDLPAETARSYPAIMSPVAISGTTQRVAPPPLLGADIQDVLAEWVGQPDSSPSPGVSTDG